MGPLSIRMDDEVAILMSRKCSAVSSHVLRRMGTGDVDTVGTSVSLFPIPLDSEIRAALCCWNGVL